MQFILRQLLLKNDITNSPFKMILCTEPLWSKFVTTFRPFLSHTSPYRISTTSNYVQIRAIQKVNQHVPVFLGSLTTISEIFAFETSAHSTIISFLSGPWVLKAETMTKPASNRKMEPCMIFERFWNNSLKN